MDDPDVTRVPEPPKAPTEPPEVLVGRYQIGAIIGRGGSGTVFQARDTLAGDLVAVKLVPMLGAHARRQLRRELTALLALKIPGVARFRDEGVFGDKTFFVTDLVHGHPFDHATDRTWHKLKHRAIALLDVVARMHLAGVIHRDLKPANVMVDDDGKVTLLDFGLAQGRLIERHSQGLIEGSPRYMAPEQRSGLPCDERTDLYAVGGMLLELFTGERLSRPPKLHLLEGRGLPSAVCTLIAAMLAEDPNGRPSSALAALKALGEDPRARIGRFLPQGPYSEEQLRELFVDKKRSFLHLAEDAAALLFEETQGEESQVHLTLDRWIGSGLASWTDGGKIAITRPSIEQIAASREGSAQSQLVSLLESGREPEEVSAKARLLAKELSDEGYLERALSLLDAAELWARETPAEIDLLQDRVVYALALESPSACERALFAVQRVEMEQGQRSTLTSLLRGGRAAFAGESERALQYLASKPQSLPEPLEVYWHGVRWKAVSQLDLDTHERELLSIEGWAGESLLRTGKWKGWLGYLRYRQQRYSEAAALLVDAASARTSPRERAQMLYMAAAASVEAGSLDDAQRLAESARQMFRDGRNTTLEAAATWLLRMSELRQREGVPDLELLEAAAEVPSIAHHIALTEAGCAFRMGNAGLCREILSRFPDLLEEESPIGWLARGLYSIVSSDKHPPDDLTGQLSTHTPQIAIQVLGLYARAAATRPAWQAEGRRLLAALTKRAPNQRMELLSLQEAAAWLDIDLPHGKSGSATTSSGL